MSVRSMTRNLSCLIAVIFIVLVLGQTASAQNVIASSGSPSPSIVFLDGDTTSTALSALDAAPPSPPEGCVMNSPTWSWAITLTQYSGDGSSYGSPPTNDYSAMISQDSSSSANATLEADFGAGGAGVGGYYQFTCQATVQYQDSCGDKWSGSGTTTATDTALGVTIERQPDGGGGYAPIGPGNKNVLPGEFIDLKAVLVPAVPATFQWIIAPTNFKNYNIATGTLTQLAAADLAKQSVQFSWTDPGTKNVGCIVAAGGQFKSFNATLTVLALTINPLYTTTLGTTQISAAGDALGLFAAGGVRPGITFTAGVNVPAGFAAGQWAYLQTVNTARHQTLNNGTKQHVSINGTVVLDTVSPYDGPYATGTIPPPTTNDSPDLPLNAAITNSSVTNEQFNMYIMFKPAGGGSQWVPVQYVNWSWSGSATKGAGGAWTLDKNSGFQNANPAAATAIHPQWTWNFTRLC